MLGYISLSGRPDSVGDPIQIRHHPNCRIPSCTSHHTHVETVWSRFSGLFSPSCLLFLPDKLCSITVNDRRCPNSMCTERLLNPVWILFAPSLKLLCLQFKDVEMFSLDHSSKRLRSRDALWVYCGYALLGNPEWMGNNLTMLERLILHLGRTTW